MPILRDRKRTSAVRNMLSNGMSVEQAAQFSGLSVEEGAAAEEKRRKRT